MVAVEWGKPSATVRKVIKNLTARVKPRSGVFPPLPGRSASDEGWRAYMIRTTTGELGAQLHPVDGSWEIPLNGTESWKIKVSVEDLEGVDRAWYTEGIGGVLITWTVDGKEIPWVAGPVTQWDAETDGFLEYSGGGIREWYARLVIGTDLRVRNKSLGHIMWLIAKQAELKPGGGPPIYDATPDPLGRGHERNYMAWDLANGGMDKRMSELSAVINGPDVMFRPEWANDAHTRIRWGCYHGTSQSARIQSPTVHVFDTTAAYGSLSSVEVRTSSSFLVSRVWATGAGSGAGTMIARAEDHSLVSAGFPFYETVISDTSATADTEATTELGTDKRVPIALSVGNGVRNAPLKATVRIPLALRTGVKKWRLHIENRNPSTANGSPRTAHVKFGDLYMGSNWNNGGMGDPKKVVDIIDISAGSSETVTEWVEENIEENIVFSFSYETSSAPHACYGGGWVRKDVRDSAREGFKGQVKTTDIPFHVWIEAYVEESTPVVAMVGSSSAAGFGANLPIFDSPLTWFCREHKAIPVHYAIPGDTMLNSLDPKAYKWTKWSGMSRPDKVLMYLGSDDIFGSASLDELKSRTERIIDIIADKMTTQIYMVTIPPRTTRVAEEGKRREYNQWLSSGDVPISKGVYDFVTPISSDDETIRKEYDADGTHLNEKGYRVQARALWGLVEAYYEDGKTIYGMSQSKELAERALGELTKRQDGIDQITVEVSSFDPLYGLGQWYVGDTARVKVKGWLSVPDGVHNTRIINASGDFKDTVKIDFQEAVIV